MSEIFAGEKTSKKHFWLKICGKLKLVYSINIVWCVHYLSRPKHLVVRAIRLAQLLRTVVDLVRVWHLNVLVAFHCCCFCTTDHKIQKAKQKRKSGCPELFICWDRGVMVVESSTLGTLRSGYLWLWRSDSSSLKWHKNTSLCTLGVDPCDNVFFEDCNSGVLFNSFYKYYLRTFFIPEIAFWAGDNSPRTLQSGRVYGFLRLFHVVSILYY